MVNDAISPFELHFTLMSFISIVVESIREDEYSNQTTLCGQHKKGFSTMLNFFLDEKCDIVQRGVSNS